jgi:hypothetical protein
MGMLLVKAHNVELAAQRPEILRDLEQLDRLGLERREEFRGRSARHGRPDVGQGGRPVGGLGAAVRGAEEDDAVCVVVDVNEGGVVFCVLESLGVGVWL